MQEWAAEILPYLILAPDLSHLILAPHPDMTPHQIFIRRQEYRWGVKNFPSFTCAKIALAPHLTKNPLFSFS